MPPRKTSRSKRHPSARKRSKGVQLRVEQRATHRSAAGPHARKGARPDARLHARKDARKSVGALFEALVALQARLRAPGGCPWDREQTHATLRTFLLEESYEVLDALESGDSARFAGELGDLLLQVVFHAGLAAEDGRFDIGDVIERVHDKMIRRHPHVFGDVKAATSADVLKNWEQLKAEERRAEGANPGNGLSGSQLAENSSAGNSGVPSPASILDGVPRSLPALLEAHQLTRRAANVGFDWKRVDGLFEKLGEEAGEIGEALAANDRARLEEEVGDLLFVGVNLARFFNLDAEIALKKANVKFSSRFRAMETIAAGSGRALSGFSSDELEALWEQAKSQVRRGPSLDRAQRTSA